MKDKKVGVEKWLEIVVKCSNKWGTLCFCQNIAFYFRLSSYYSLLMLGQCTELHCFKREFVFKMNFGWILISFFHFFFREAADTLKRLQAERDARRQWRKKRLNFKTAAPAIFLPITFCISLLTCNSIKRYLFTWLLKDFWTVLISWWLKFDQKFLPSSLRIQYSTSWLV